MDRRRSVRHFAADPVPRELIELAIATANTAPSGHIVSRGSSSRSARQALKRRIRVAAEEEERQSYQGRMPPEWLEALAPLGTEWHKPYLETVPWLVVVFEELYSLAPDGRPRKNYYVKESVGIACGLFITALHQMGLATLTHTPSPMGFLSERFSAASTTRNRISCFPLATPPPTPRCRTCGGSR